MHLYNKPRVWGATLWAAVTSQNTDNHQHHQPTKQWFMGLLYSQTCFLRTPHLGRILVSNPVSTRLMWLHNPSGFGATCIRLIAHIVPLDFDPTIKAVVQLRYFNVYPRVDYGAEVDTLCLAHRWFAHKRSITTRRKGTSRGGALYRMYLFIMS